LNDSNIQTNILMYTEDDISEGAMANMNIQSSAEATGPETEDTSPDVEMLMDQETATHPNPAASETPLFVVDTEGDPSLAVGWKSSGKRPLRRDTSPTPSDSSEEVVLFHGRQQPTTAKQPTQHTRLNGNVDSTEKTAPSPRPTAQQTATSPVPASIDTPITNKAPEPVQNRTPHITDDLLRALERSTPQPSPQPSGSAATAAMGWATRQSKLDMEVEHNATWAPAPAIPYWRKGRARPDLDPSADKIMASQTTSRSAGEVAFAEPEPDAAQTIAALQADWKAVQREKQQAKPSQAPDEIKLDSRSPMSKRRGKRGRKKDNRSLRDPFVEDEDDDDDDGEAAYDDYMANLAAQLEGEEIDVKKLASQTTLLGESSLFVDGEEVADDQVLKSHLKLMADDDDDSCSSSGFSGVIGQDLSELSSSDLEDELDYTEREQWEDEEDLRERRRERMTDEQIARMFAKQQEFGYHGDDLIIDDGEHSGEAEGVGDVASARAVLANMTNFTSSANGTRRRTRRSGGNDNFPDASMLADTVEQYGENGFDIMDLDRPSLRPTKKGRKGRLPPEMEALSDDELRENLRGTWDNDRQKKSAKKAEREELRAAGWLSGSGKKGKQDLSVKYGFGISMEQVHTELRVFLLNENQQSRPFPPMDKKDRKVLHEVATVLNLKSKSIGSGKDRYSTVYKTDRTPNVPGVIDRMLGLSMDGQFSRDARLGRRMAKKNAKMGAGKGFGQKGGTGPATVRNGEIVGANAPELGRGNFGHKLMEKMGWSQGMALGREGEGRLLPVEQVIRLGTTGLGGS